MNHLHVKIMNNRTFIFFRRITRIAKEKRM